MKTYSVDSDVFGIIELPNEIDNIDEAISYVEYWWTNSGEVRLVEHRWHCISQTPFMIDTSYRS